MYLKNKLILLSVLVLLLCATFVLSDTVTLNSAGTIVSDNTIGTDAWSNPTNAASSDNNDATSGCADGPGCNIDSEYLKATKFSATIPSGSTITGIFPEVEGSTTCTFGCNAWLKLVLPDDSLSPSIESNSSSWSSDAYHGFGERLNLWGEVWTAEDINNDNFGVAFNGTSSSGPGGSTTFFVDHIKLTVTYEPPAIPKKLKLSNNGKVSISGTNKLRFYR